MRHLVRRRTRGACKIERPIGRLKSKNVWLDNAQVVRYTKIIGLIGTKLKTLRAIKKSLIYEVVTG